MLRLPHLAGRTGSRRVRRVTVAWLAAAGLVAAGLVVTTAPTTTAADEPVTLPLTVSIFDLATPGTRQYIVPADAASGSLQATIRGGRGGDVARYGSSFGEGYGLAAVIGGTIMLQPGDVVDVQVAGAGRQATWSGDDGVGFGGGGRAGRFVAGERTRDLPVAGGGGATVVQVNGTVVLVAAGGGGEGGSSTGLFGIGGGGGDGGDAGLPGAAKATDGTRGDDTGPALGGLGGTGASAASAGRTAGPAVGAAS